MGDETDDVELNEPESIDVPAFEGWGPTTITYFGHHSRTVLVSGEIEEHLCSGITSQLQALASVSDSPITLYINTNGGSIIDALAIYDMIRIIPVPVVGIVNGACFSAGLIILAACDLKLATPNSMFFYHQPIMTILDIGSLEQSESSRMHYQWSLKTIDRLIKDATGISKKVWKKQFKNKTAKHFSVAQAMKWGFIQDIYEFAEKPELDLVEFDGE